MARGGRPRMVWQQSTVHQLHLLLASGSHGTMADSILLLGLHRRSSVGSRMEASDGAARGIMVRLQGVRQGGHGNTVVIMAPRSLGSPALVA